MTNRRARHEFLARAGLASDERRPHVWGHTSDQVEQLLHRGTSPHHPVEFEVARQLDVRVHEPLPPLDAVSNGAEQLAEAIEIEWLGHVIERAELDGVDGRVHRRVSGHQDHLTLGVDVPDGAEDIEPSHFRHVLVEERDVGLERRQFREQSLAAHASDDLKVLLLGKPLDEGQHARLVVNHQEEGTPVRHGESLVGGLTRRPRAHWWPSSASPTFRSSSASVNGLPTKCTCDSSTPCRTTVSLV